MVAETISSQALLRIIKNSVMEKSVIGLFVMRSRGEQFISNFYLISKNRLGNGKCQHRKDGLFKKARLLFCQLFVNDPDHSVL